MNTTFNRFVTASLMSGLLVAAGWKTATRSAPRTAVNAPSWRQTLAQRIPLYGHRNWIVIADAAYPAQASAGIETVVADADHLEVVQAVLKALGGSKHVRPIVFTDAELKYVSEKDAPGVTAYRERLSRALGDSPVSVLPHEQIIARLDEAGKTFRVLIIKTPLAVPYTSVFLQLDCGYWSADAERRLREAVPGKRPLVSD
jgi:L-fucose mutarotase/ribose pyranase (RbsD/FucU family)